jgi:hypothetical protein
MGLVDDRLAVLLGKIVVSSHVALLARGHRNTGS